MSLLFLRGNHNSGRSSVYNPCCLPFLSCKTTWPIGSRMRLSRHAKKGATVQPGIEDGPYSRAGTTRKDSLEPLVSDALPPPRTGHPPRPRRTSNLRSLRRERDGEMVYKKQGEAGGNLSRWQDTARGGGQKEKGRIHGGHCGEKQRQETAAKSQKIKEKTVESEPVDRRKR